MRQTLTLALISLSILCWGILPAVHWMSAGDIAEWVSMPDETEDDRGEENKGEVDDEVKKWAGPSGVHSGMGGASEIRFHGTAMAQWETPFQKGLLEPPELS